MIFSVACITYIWPVIRVDELASNTCSAFEMLL